VDSHNSSVTNSQVVAAQPIRNLQLSPYFDDQSRYFQVLNPDEQFRNDDNMILLILFVGNTGMLRLLVVCRVLLVDRIILLRLRILGVGV
jgi:hypothetical protein